MLHIVQAKNKAAKRLNISTLHQFCIHHLVTFSQFFPSIPDKNPLCNT